MKQLARCCFLVLALVKFEDVYAFDVKESNECQAMVQYALSKHVEYSKGKTISELLDQEESSQDNEKQKFYKSLVVEILDTFAVWDDHVERKRVDEEISDHFFSICDPEKIKGVFK